MKTLFYKTWAAILAFANDDRGQALTEYAISSACMVIISMYLIYPDNRFYSAFRDWYDWTTTVLMLPGP